MNWRRPLPPTRSFSRTWRERSGSGNARSTSPRAVEWAPARGLVAYYPFDSDLAPQVAVLHEAKNARPAALRRAAMRALPAPSLAPGRIGQAASFDGKTFVQFGGDIAGFDSYGAGRGAIGANDPTVTYDDGTRWPRGSIPPRRTARS